MNKDKTIQELEEELLNLKITYHARVHELYSKANLLKLLIPAHKFNNIIKDIDQMIINHTEDLNQSASQEPRQPDPNQDIPKTKPIDQEISQNPQKSQKSPKIQAVDQEISQNPQKSQKIKAIDQEISQNSKKNIICICGGTYSRNKDRLRHERTTRHIKYNESIYNKLDK